MTHILGEELARLRETVRDVCDDHSAELRVREVAERESGFDRNLWRILCEQIGATGISVPEEYGGIGCGVRELAVVMSELGRSLACVPFLPSIVMAVTALRSSGDAQAQERYLPGLASGEVIGTVVANEDGRQWDPDAVRLRASLDASGEWVVSGSARHVIYGAVADLVLAAARTTNGISLFAIDQGALSGEVVTVAPEDVLDLTRPLAAVEYRGARGTLVGGEGAAERFLPTVIDIVTGLLTAEMAAGAQRTLEMAVRYAKERRQFGRPIGSFQAIKHKCANMLIEIEKARSASEAAVAAAESGSEDVGRLAGLAKAVCAEAYALCASENLQIHGGLGFTWEHASQLYFKRARSTEVLFGGPSAHWDRLGTKADPVPGSSDRNDTAASAVDRADADGYRRRVSEWIANEPRPAGLRDYGSTPAAGDVGPGARWQRQLAAAGYACLHWPPEYGGAGASVTEQAIFAEEAARAGVPRQLGITATDLVGPVLIAFGTAEQKGRYLERIRTGVDIWCQLFSEPEAGSDLAGVTTKARPDANGTWVVDGRKIWSSAAADARYGLLLARTGPERYRGLSAFVVPMDADGVTVRPIMQMDGESKFNEVFLDQVRLGPDATVGAVGQGWQVALATLGRERLTLGSQAVSMFKSLEVMRDQAIARGMMSPELGHKLTRLWARMWLLRATWQRATNAESDPGSSTFSVLKLMTSEIHRDLGDLATEVLGADACYGPQREPLVQAMLVGHAQTVLGGTSEIQRNILAERVLGLPREQIT